MRRRSFLGASTAALTTSLLTGCQKKARSSSSALRILVLGGTNFLGPAIVERARSRGHRVTLFNRGITRPELFPDLEKLRGDRSLSNEDLGALKGTRTWDVVIDVWPEDHAADMVQHALDLLAPRVGFYHLCSSIAVYRQFAKPNDESSPTHSGDRGWYGADKATAETILAERMPDRFGINRCHAILGPRDDGSAHHYWLRRLATEKRVLAPGSGNDPVQYSDVRDVGAWIVEGVESRRTGIYNHCGPANKQTFRNWLETTRAAIGSNAQLVWVDADVLRKDFGVRSFTEMPMWAPIDEDAAFYRIDNAKSLEAGAVYRPIEDTARDAWRWFQSYFFRDTSFPRAGWGISKEREQVILKAIG